MYSVLLHPSELSTDTEFGTLSWTHPPHRYVVAVPCLCLRLAEANLQGIIRDILGVYETEGRRAVAEAVSAGVGAMGSTVLCERHRRPSSALWSSL